MRFDLGTLDSGERSLPFGLLVYYACRQDIVGPSNQYVVKMCEDIFHYGKIFIECQMYPYLALWDLS